MTDPDRPKQPGVDGEVEPPRSGTASSKNRNGVAQNDEQVLDLAETASHSAGVVTDQSHSPGVFADQRSTNGALLHPASFSEQGNLDLQTYCPQHEVSSLESTVQVSLL